MDDYSDLIADYDFELDPALIAQRPEKKPDDARLLLVRLHPEKGMPRFEDLQVKDLPRLVAETPSLQKMMWVRNRSKVLRARFYAKRESGGEHEIVLVEPLEGGRWKAMIRREARLKFPCELDCGGEKVLVLDKGLVSFEKLSVPLENFLNLHGEMPLPPYITERNDEEDSRRYQSIWAQDQHASSVAAPTASLHFTDKLWSQLTEDFSIPVFDLALHVGLGTFEPVRAERLSEHKIHGENFEISSRQFESAVDYFAKYGRNFLCLGTTSLRCLESLSLKFGLSQKSEDVIYGRSEVFIKGDFPFQYCRALWTNFHLPQSTLLALVSSFCGSRVLALEAYNRAVKKKYRFFSYGDASLWI